MHSPKRMKSYEPQGARLEQNPKQSPTESFRTRERNLPSPSPAPFRKNRRAAYFSGTVFVVAWGHQEHPSCMGAPALTHIYQDGSSETRGTPSCSLSMRLYGRSSSWSSSCQGHMSHVGGSHVLNYRSPPKMVSFGFPLKPQQKQTHVGVDQYSWPPNK